MGQGPVIYLFFYIQIHGLLNLFFRADRLLLPALESHEAKKLLNPAEVSWIES